MSEPELVQISASAGAGKTWTLTANYVERLAKIYNKNCDAAALARRAATILAVTFTNAAANEMRSRVLERLKEQALENGENSEEAGCWLKAFLQEPAGLNIRTIDSVLHQIVRASALDLKIPPDYEIEFDVMGALAPHVDALLERCREPGDEQALLRKACRVALEAGPSGGFLAKGRIMAPLKDVLEDCLQGKFANLASEDEINGALARLDKNAKDSARTFLDIAEKGKWSNRTRRNSIERYANGDYPQKPSAVLARPCQELFREAPAAGCLEDAWRSFVNAALAWHYGHLILEKGRYLKPFVDLANKVADSFRKAQADAGIALQSLVPGWASQALSGEKGVTDALCRMGSRLTHFLVDEFQDTSAEQWRVLHALVLEAISRGGSFTWVGDVKQSIYGWRGGDPRLFYLALHDPQLTAVVKEPRTIPLENNWRSLPAIVEHTNALFMPLAEQDTAGEAAECLLGKDANRQVLAETAQRITASFANVKQECQKKDKGPGFVWAEEIDGEDGADGLSDRVCRLLLDDIGKRRPWSDVMILVRRNKDARALVAKLGELRIPVITENGLLLNENSLIIQTIAFLEFLYEPANDVAFWTVIKGAIFAGHPFAASLRDLNLDDWAAGREGKGAIWRQFRQDFPEVWKTAIAPFFHRDLLMTAYDITREWYKRMEVESRFPDDVTMLRRLLETLHLAENNGQATIAGFLEYWRHNSESEKAPMPDKMNAVQITTIHKAKGLEAPVVIVPGADYPVKVTDDPVVLEAGDVKVASNYLKEEGPVYEREIVRQGLEALNLLYVALTRAEEELYILYQKGKKKSLKDVLALMQAKSGLAFPYSLGSKAAPAPDHVPYFAPLESGSAGWNGEAPSQKWKPMAWMPDLKIYHTELASKTLTAAQRGTVMHSCLERMGYSGDAGKVAAAALKAGVSGSAIAVPEESRPELLAALEWFAEEMPGQDWMTRGWREQPLVNGKGDLLRADLIVPEPWGPLVVDYKTGEPRPKHITQLTEYMKTLAESGQFAGRPCGLLVYLDKRQFLKVPFRGGINLVKPTDEGPDLVETLPPLP